MYCPNCATENLDNASFCRGCGANISLVPQALTGNLPVANEDALDDDSDYGRRRRRRGRKGKPSVHQGIRSIFMGLAFVCVAFAARVYMPGAFTWWFWMLIPAFMMLGGGVSELVRFKMEKSPALPAVAPRPAAMPAAPVRPSALPPRNTAELIPQPHSVTEGTTRHLETPVKGKQENV